MLYVIIFLSLISISIYLAWRSMKDFREKPSAKAPYGIFLLKDPAFINESLVDRIYSLSLQTPLRYKINPLIISFERLNKGSNPATVIYAPVEFIKQCNINVVELEDYADKIPLSSVQSWEAGYEGALKDFPEKINFLDRVHLDDEERVFLQLSMIPVGKFHQARFQATLRFAVAALDIGRRIEISKVIQEAFNKYGFKKINYKQPSSDIYKEYKARSVLPEEIRLQVLGSKEIVALGRFS